MVRVLSGIALLSIVAIALYLPSQFPPERFFSHLLAEHERNSQYWGSDTANLILERALDLHSAVATAPSAVAPKLTETGTPASQHLQTHLRLDEMVRRFTESNYVRGLSATLLLAEYRLSALWQLAPYGVIFFLLAVGDGQVVRIVRSYEFGDHSPMAFGIFAFALIAVLWSFAVSLVVPVGVHPLWYGAFLLAVGCLSGIIVANFHRSALKPQAGR